MFEENQETYFIDYHFLENQKEVNSFNWLEYFENHPEFDNSCLNLKHIHDPKLNLDQLFKNKENGIFYKYEIKENSIISTISKYLIDEQKIYLLKIYYLLENKIFDSANMKSTLLQKTANIAILLNKVVETAFDIN